MCGIAGIWDRRRRMAPNALAALAGEMTETLHHRGPDAGDLWRDDEAGLALGHRRLSIVDLSPAGAQPMVSSCGRFVLSYNGEVYNADELRPELEAAGRRFRGHCDSEIIVEGAAVWGVRATIERIIGMFALALWDRRERVLYLVRDRLGIKPVYWADFGGRILFGSELKALRADPSWTPALDREALTSYLRLGYVLAPLTIYRGVQKLQPGMILTARENGPPEIAPFWSLAEIARAGQAERLEASVDEAEEQLDALLRDAIGRRMVADVPLGAFLSGGIDSSTVVALMQAQSTRPVRSFTIGFRERGFDEAQHAAAVARHLGTDHTELYVSPEHALEVIPSLPTMYDEPFADSSQIPTFLVSELTRRHVTVALSGDGGDELFAGYTRYLRGETVWRTIEMMPQRARELAAAGVRAFSPATWSALASVIPEARRPAQFGDKMHKLANVLDGEAEASAFYRQVISLWLDPATIVKGGVEPRGLMEDAGVRELVPDFVERMQYIDTLTYLPDDILTKVDRASMAVALEARVPMLDHRVVAFSWSLPPEMKTNGGVGKRLLRRVLYRYVPKELVERPKMGFSVPIGAWLRGPLREWADRLLDERRLAAEGVFHPAPIVERWRAHRQGTHDWQASLWPILMFQAWKERWLA
ncbi:MAG TPA: asparagine synthase (glutamine-hydrolyzing) [Stellaceae bacterium]|nr:asparagine synthase (glutamine-hydrolyzing) [Stellaceae bacterium]